MPKAPENLREFSSLLKVVEALRGPGGCPWDKEQTHASLTRYAIEEAFELSEAIDSQDKKALCDELGDVLLQVILHAEIARQAASFDIFSVIENLNLKMIRRHPHVFESTDGSRSSAPDSAAVLKNWSEIKAEEKGHAENHPLSFDIPVALPALLRSQKIGEKTKKFSFDWQNANACLPKIHEEIKELEEAMQTQDQAQVTFELGDLLFSIVQLARHLKIDSEQALRQTNRRFESRFQKMQQLVESAGLEWNTLTNANKETYWKKAKSQT